MVDERAQQSGAAGTEEETGEVARVEELLRTLSSAVRSYRLYAGNSPMLERFVESLRARVETMWEHFARIRLEIGESAMFWEGRKVFPTGDAAGDLAFLFYKDGIRAITLLPGLETEVPALLSVLGRAPHLHEEEDDLVTLLWQENLTGISYDSVDLAVEPTELGEESGAAPARIDPVAVREAAADRTEGAALVTDDFRETVYFLDEQELRRLEREVELERERDLWGDVINALLDRLEDGSEERQIRIAGILDELLPSLLAAGAYGSAASLLDQLSDLAGSAEHLPVGVLRAIRSIFDQLGTRGTLQQIAQAMDEHSRSEDATALGELFRYFPPQALAPLTILVESASRPDTRRELRTAAERLAAENREQVVALLSEEDPLVVRGALRWVGDLSIGSAAAEVIRLMRHQAPSVRAASAEAAAALRASTAGPTLIALLSDPERDVRVAAARALASLAHGPAGPALEAAIQGKRLRAADRSEKLAFFEALGRTAGADAIPFLEKLLNSRNWLGRGESAEIRACAAFGLARIRHPAAVSALRAAADDSDPVVRSAVARSLRGEDA